MSGEVRELATISFHQFNTADMIRVKLMLQNIEEELCTELIGSSLLQRTSILSTNLVAVIEQYHVLGLG